MYEHGCFPPSIRGALWTGLAAGVRRSAPLLLLLGLPALAQEPSWQSTEQPDPINGGTLSIAERQVEGARVVVRCESSRRWLEVRVFFDRPVVEPSVTWQFDETYPRTQRWLRSPNNLSLIVPQALRADFLFRLQVYRTLALTVDGRQLRIPLNGSAKAIAQSTAICLG